MRGTISHQQDAIDHPSWWYSVCCLTSLDQVAVSPGRGDNTKTAPSNKRFLSDSALTIFLTAGKSDSATCMKAPSCFASQCQVLISPMGMQVRAGRCLLLLQQPVSLCPLMLTAWRHTTARCPASSASCLWMLVSSADALSSLSHL